MISSVEQPHVKLSGDYEGPYVVEEARSDGRLLVAPDTSAQAIMERLGHEPATLAEFEAALRGGKAPRRRALSRGPQAGLFASGF